MKKNGVYFSCSRCVRYQIIKEALPVTIYFQAAIHPQTAQIEPVIERFCGAKKLVRNKERPGRRRQIDQSALRALEEVS